MSKKVKINSTTITATKQCSNCGKYNTYWIGNNFWRCYEDSCKGLDIKV